VTKLKKGLEKGKLTGAMGVEAVVTLRRIGIEPDYLYGVPQAAIDAARSGLSFDIVCTGSEALAVVQKLITENIKYTRIDTRKKR
jgi:putative transcriptional regulator